MLHNAPRAAAKSASAISPSTLPPLLRLEHVLRVVPVSKSLWWAGVRTGRYPAPLRDGRITMWRSSDIAALIESWSTVEGPGGRND